MLFSKHESNKNDIFANLRSVLSATAENYFTKAKKNKTNVMSQSSWQIGRPDLNAFFNRFFFSLSLFLFFFFFFFLLSSRRVRFESFTALKYGTWFWMNKIQDRTQSWRSLLFKVFHCVCHIFSCIFWQVHKKLGKS